MTNRTRLDVLIGPLDDAIREATRSAGQSPSEESIWNLMMGLVHLGGAVPPGGQGWDAPALQEFLADSARTLPLLTPAMGSFHVDTLHRLRIGWEPVYWVSACYRRSAVEFLKTFYAQTSYADFLGKFETDDLDEELRFRGAGDGPVPAEDVPDGMPASHWWWWFPDAPPAAGPRRP